jgi:hypothetical protein
VSYESVTQGAKVESFTTGSFGALFELSRLYAQAVDRRDVEGFLRVFTADARLSICSGVDPDQVVRTISGTEELAAVPTSLERFDRTFHFLGQAGYEVDGGRATGEVYCIAHHLSVGETGAQNMVLYIRYADEYRADASEGWRITHRRLQWDWAETRAADAPATYYSRPSTSSDPPDQAHGADVAPTSLQ